MVTLPAIVTVAAALVVLLLGNASASPPTTERVSVAPDGSEANNGSDPGAITPDSRFVAFASAATNLVPSDTNGATDLLLRDQQTGAIELLSVDSLGNQANGWSGGQIDISGDARFVVFESDALNLVPGDTNNERDIFVRDRVTSVTERVSVSSSGLQGNGESLRPAISADGRSIAFASYASNLVPEDMNSYADIFVHDRLTGVTERVSVSSSGEEGDYTSYAPDISADGRFVAFVSFASNLVQGDTNGCYDDFIHDRLTGATERVSVDSNGDEGESPFGGGCSGAQGVAVSGDGRFVAFASELKYLVPEDDGSLTDAFVHDRETGITQRVSVNSAGEPASRGIREPVVLSEDGRFVLFKSASWNLVPGDTNTCENYITPGECPDVFEHDRNTGMTERVSVSSSGEEADYYSWIGDVSGTGRIALFGSWASNLVPDDTNGAHDVFIHDRGSGSTDSDQDGFPDAVDNCPSDYNPTQVDANWDGVGEACAACLLVPWAIPPDDEDCDGSVTGDVDSGEVFFGTDPADACSDTAILDDERGSAFGEPEPAWPFDINDDQVADFGDILAFAPHFNKTWPDPDYSARFDFYIDGTVDFGDILQYGPYFNKDCTDYFVP